MAFTELNMFSPEPVQGMLAISDSKRTLGAMFKPLAGSEFTTLKAGDPVSFQTGNSLIPLVRHLNESDADMVGLVAFAQDKVSYTDGDTLEVNLTGTIVHMRTTSAIRRGDEFEGIGISIDDKDAGEFTRVSIRGIL